MRGRQFLGPSIVVLLYTVFSVLFLINVDNEEDWTAVDAAYFAFATMSTVGYGDLSPTTRRVRAFTIMMIFVGVGLVFPLVGKMTSSLASRITGCGRAILERMFPPQYVDLDGDGTKDYPVPRKAHVWYFKRLLPSFALLFFVQLLSAAIFVAIEDWTFEDAFYHCIVTVSTVGYGDMYIVSQAGRLFSSIHMLLGVCLFAEFMRTIDTARSDLKLARQRYTAMTQELNTDLLGRLNALAGDLRPLDEDPKGLTELEFVITMLLHMGCIDKLTLQPFLKQFRRLDVTTDGRLNVEDIEKTQALKRQSTAALRAVRMNNSHEYQAKVQASMKRGATWRPSAGWKLRLKTAPQVLDPARHGGRARIAPPSAAPASAPSLQDEAAVQG